MSWFPWSSSGRNETILQEKANFMPNKQQRLPPVTQIPLLNKMKRKRDDSTLLSPRLGSPAPKRRTETLGHIQVPYADAQVASLPPQEDQVNGERLSNQALEMHISQGPDRMMLDGAQDHSSAQDQTMVLDGAQNHPSAQDQTISNTPETPNRPNGVSLRGGETGARRSLSSAEKRAALRETIESQFSLEILLKHKELRLIDQEFAKCQIALEQLRRCQIIPYPAMSSVFEDLQAATSGSGPSFNNRAPYAPPWGVTNGPYSRHYERWLIPDSAFDENVVETPQTPAGIGKSLADRPTRGSKSEKGIVASKSRSQRGSTSARLKALPHGYPEPKEEKGPMIVKRSSDGKMVKLVCLDCRRSNFNSAQGFINHCRIAHSRQFLSHDAAIEASGEEIDADTEAGLGEMSGSQTTASAGLVHPLIRSAHLARNNSPTETANASSRRRRTQASSPLVSQPAVTTNAPQAMSAANRRGLGISGDARSDPAPFVPSPQTPHLSAFLARMGHGGDLDELVTEATTRPDVDLTTLSDEEDGSDAEGIANTPQNLEVPQSRSTRGVLRGGGGEPFTRTTRSPTPSQQISSQPSRSNVASQRPAYLPNITQHAPYPSPYESINRAGHHGHQTSMLDHQSPLNLSPNTIESHTAPSLVSDDGDYENTHSESEAPSSAEADDEDHYIHAEVMDHDDMDLGEGSSGSQEHHLALGGKPHGPSAGRRSSAMRAPTAIHHGASEERHVSFASPQRRLRRGSRAKEEH
ncbi:hypothetical protein JMJ35_003222 [Cladonia borealis]|uniref:AHC1-like C2H2 zinc-finger domain-containing protein n=1 Tax=Cladonia borealis TaxID=184061 RepID=A0AA39V973_9LECA|nr:hypothetical protein JMJ35_003222 [Cladonia borealis]